MITIDRLAKSYGETRAVNGISLEVRKGEILGLLGPNGAGKTTTLRILTGYLQADGGTITIDGEDIRLNPQQSKQRIGYLPESAPVYPDMLTYDYLLYVAGLRGLTAQDRDSRVHEVARLCGILEVMHKPIETLSKGYRQRVGLAHALIGDPDILVLDEPTSGLDPNQIAEIRSIIKDIGKSRTIIFSTHILSEAEATCDRVVILNRGNLVADDATSALLGQRQVEQIRVETTGPEAPELQTFLETFDEFSQISVSGNSENCTARFVGPQGSRRRFYERFKTTDWTLLGLGLESRSLEAVFRELTREV